MQGFSVIGRNSATDWPQHEITRQQKKEIAERQQKAWPLTLADIDQVQNSLFPDRLLVSLAGSIRPVQGVTVHYRG